MKKKPIGILDEGFQGINVFSELQKIYKYENFIYVNDILNSPYEGKEEDTINKFVSDKINFLLLCDVKAIVVVSSVIVEYCLPLLETLKVPVIRIDEAIIKYISKEYDQKNIALVASESVIKANLYQKNFRYNHLYSIFSEDLLEIVMSKKVKTSLSFQKMREAVKFILNKEVDIFLMVDSCLENLYTEINEYVKTQKISSLSEIIKREIDEKGIITNAKGRGSGCIYLDISKKEFINTVYWLKANYKYELFENRKTKILNEIEKNKIKMENKKVSV